MLALFNCSEDNVGGAGDVAVDFVSPVARSIGRGKLKCVGCACGAGGKRIDCTGSLRVVVLLISETC